MAVHPQNHVSFFSGAGGLDLAVRLAVPDARCIGYVEIELPAAAILAARIADGSVDEAPIWPDIRTFPCGLYCGRVAGAVFGFPCQDLSVAGKQAGINEGNRSGLFFEAMRVVREVGCEWVFLENVPPVLAFPAGHTVLRELAESGFDAEWISVRAADVRAPHRRERVFILAHRTSGGLRELRESSRRSGLTGGGSAWSSPIAHDGGKQSARSHQGANLTRDAEKWITPDAHTGSRPGMTATSGGQVHLVQQANAWRGNENGEG